MNCLAVDDESLALDLLEDNIRKVPFLNLVKRCKNAFEAQEVMQQQPIDLLFLDIQMPGISGVQFVQSMTQAPMVIFVTAYEEFALEGFNLDVLDYLLKPVSFERFLKAVNKAYELHNLRHQETPAVVEPTPAPAQEYLFVNADYSLVKIRIADILYVEGLKDYVKIYLEGQSRPVITRLTMKAMEEKLPSGPFLRVHKSFIIAFDKIESIRNLRIKIGQVHIPISESYGEALFKAINAGKVE
ncbi:DNA-binding response regulator [Siphonobacter curvatus]|uniref:DNA-binding response regulator n=2 Tax=Siphonobacter curvatus TaxID=2094562 RepID=A0A2S7IEQ2_9BACT|nr:DNA-binding response regulator [Siphonobacter curvatus]